ncbi:MAG: response regulator [Mariniblastus sp.]
MSGEHSSKNSISQLLNMLDSIVEGIYCVDLNGDCTYANKRCLELLGFDNEAGLLGKNMHALTHYRYRDGRDYDAKDCKILTTCERGVNVHVDDEVFWRKDGTRFDAEYWSDPIKEGDAIVGAVVTFTDVTLTRVELAHRNHLARLVETSSDAIISKDLHGVITSWNQGAKDIYGYDAEEAIGQSPNFLLPQDRSEEEPEICEAIRSGSDLPQFHVKRQRKNGEICDVSVTVSPLYSADDELIGCSSIERDITDSRKSQDAVLQAIAVAEHAESLANDANKSRAEFLANVSHELRTPMNAILGMVNLTLEENLEPLVVDYLTVAKSSAESLLGLVNELLDFAKIESGKFEITNEPFDLREAVDLPAKVLSSQASEKGLEILCEVDGEIPTKLIGDGRRIQQVLTNLLSNAVKFTDTGEIVVNVKQVRDLSSEIRLRFSVTDTGIGIAPEDQKKVLQPFKQADMSSTRQHHGTGLGLSICRELVSLMGGTLKLESDKGKGSRFYFELSLPVEDDTTPADCLPTELVENLRVLIVDDNPTNLRILEKILVSWSMQPIVADNADQALRILDEAKDRDHGISLAIVDALMPQVDGFDLAERMAEQGVADRPPIVMMQSAADLGLYADRKTEAEVAHYLTKPVSQSELLNAVVDTLDLYSHPAFKQDEKRFDEKMNKPIQPLNILLVEDLSANQKVAEAILKKRGHSVVTAANGRVAVDHVSTEGQSLDVILMDVQMPVMDGFQATAAIRALADKRIAETPIIAMTAHAMQGDREACLAAGMDAYIAKPLDAKRLVETAESISLDLNASPDLELEPSDSVMPEEKVSPANPNEPTPLAEAKLKLVEYENSLGRLGGDKELLAEFVEIFMSDSPKILNDLRSAVAASDYPTVMKSAHALRGLMSNFGAQPCCDLAFRFEIAGREKNIESVKAELSVLGKLYDKLCAELRLI